MSSSSSENQSDLDSFGILIHESNYYKDAVLCTPNLLTDIKRFFPEFGSPDSYIIIRKVGRGHFSTVYLARDRRNRKVAIKILVPVDIRKYMKEIMILKNLEGNKNIIQLIDVVQDPLTKTFSWVFEWVELRKWRETYHLFNIDDIRILMKQLLMGLDYAHQRGIMHRDIKPDNIGINLETKELKILDWGLAEFYYPGKRCNPSAGTRAYLSPEQLIGYPYFDYSVDIWAAGLIFSIMLFNRIIIEPKDNQPEQIINMAYFLGGQKIIRLISEFELRMNKKLYKTLLKIEGCGLERYIGTAPKDKYTPEAVDLVSKMLKADFRFRISAHDALEHPFFKNYE